MLSKSHTYGDMGPSYTFVFWTRIISYYRIPTKDYPTTTLKIFFTFYFCFFLFSIEISQRAQHSLFTHRYFSFPNRYPFEIKTPFKIIIHAGMFLFCLRTAPCYKMTTIKWPSYVTIFFFFCSHIIRNLFYGLPIYYPTLSIIKITMYQCDWFISLRGVIPVFPAAVRNSDLVEMYFWPSPLLRSRNNENHASFPLEQHK